MSRPPRVRKPQGRSVSAQSRKPHAAVSPARLAAGKVLLAVAERKGHSDDLLHGAALAGLSQEDKNLATTLVLGVLRWQISLDARIAPLLSRPEVLPAESILIALRMGAFQLLHLDRIPVHAAIHESVELTRTLGQPQAAGMVNAILRKVSKLSMSGNALHESVAALAQRLGHPAWMVQRWVNHYGRAAATAICEFDQSEPRCGELFATGIETSLPVMDDGSRLVAEIAAASVARPNRMWDCCAAPGGKALVLAHRHPEAKLLATDVSPKRLRALSERLHREIARVTIEVKVADASLPESVDGLFDLILCDVPCSGTGTMARNPEIRHFLQPEELERQSARQKAILASALKRLAPGGKLIYSTCSLEPEECERVVDEALSVSGSFGLDRIESTLGILSTKGIVSANADLNGCLRDGMLRTLPGANLQADGFFAAVLTHTN